MERRKFTDDFSVGDVVSIIRTKHGWFDGMVEGPIVEMSDFTCKVEGTDKDPDSGFTTTYDIEKPRDIRLSYKAKPQVKRGPGRYSNR